MKKTFYVCLLFTFALASCAPGSGITLPPDMTLVPGTDIPQQVATYVSNALTQTALPPATSTPSVAESTSPVGNEAAGSSAQTLYQSPSLEIQFSYPAAWYLRETPGVVTLTSFDPAYPPHKLEWTDQTVSMQLGFKVFITPPVSFDAWVEEAKQTALAAGLSIYAEERFAIANQPSTHLTLVSGSGGIIHQVLTSLSGRYFEINTEGNYSLAKAVLDSIQPLSLTAPTFTPIPLSTITATAPPPIVEYNNSALGYSLNLPGDWTIDDQTANSLDKIVMFSPPNAEPFIAYLTILLDSRSLDQIINSYAQYTPNAVREDILFNGYSGIKYGFFHQGKLTRVEYFIPQANRIFAISTDKPNDATVQSILTSIRFTTPPQPVTYDATLADNGKTFVMNIGDKIRINYDYAYGWSTTSDFNPAVLMGAGDGYFAIASGSSTLSMTGSPECLNLTPPCAMPSILYTITVIVR